MKDEKCISIICFIELTNNKAYLGLIILTKLYINKIRYKKINISNQKYIKKKKRRFLKKLYINPRKFFWITFVTKIMEPLKLNYIKKNIAILLIKISIYLIIINFPFKYRNILQLL